LTRATEVRLPQLGKTMEEGTVIRCLVKVGDKVGRGDILFDIETDKATLEMESPATGFVKAILVEPGRTVAVHEPLLILGDKDEQVSQGLIDSITSAGKPRPAPPVPKSMAYIDRPFLGLTEGAEQADIAGAVCSNGAPSEDTYRLGKVVPIGRLQKITGQRMLRSKREIPCFYLTVRADVTELVEYREKINRSEPVKVSYNDFIIRATAMGLKRFELMTGQMEGESIRLADSIGVGLAISVPSGVVAPVVKQADEKDVRRIARDTAALIERAQNGRLSPDDLEGGCITISNLGAFGVESFIPVAVPGQCSTIGTGAIIDTPVFDPASGSEVQARRMPDGGGMVIRKLMSMTLSADHKVVNGAYAGQFLDYVRKLLETPSNLD
jgi:pyruvate dehydrogenase E2 component (dihydrolipoamide acetyltransferase)